jgi:hypothetical protein
MSTVEQIKAAISRLSIEERAGLATWLFYQTDDAWDRQMKGDANAGRLNKLIAEAERDIRAGQVRELP